MRLYAVGQCYFLLMDSSFEKVYASYKHQIYFFVKNYVKSQDDTEDIVQDIFVHLFKHQSALNHNTEAVIFKTAKQEVANFYRRNQLDFSELSENHDTDMEADITDEELSEARLLKIEEILKTVPDKSKDFFLKSKSQGWSYSEIAAENHISKNAVAKHVNKVLDLLKSKMSLFLL